MCPLFEFPMSIKRLCAFFAGLLLSLQYALADATYVQVTAFPSLSVADGRSTVSITAVVRDENSKPVPDGTQVVFSTTLGKFRDEIVSTSGGVATAVLVASSDPGVATITAAPQRGNASTQSVTYEFVANKNLLNQSGEHIDVSTSGFMQFTPENRLLIASAPKAGVVLRFREITIKAADLELNVMSPPLYTVRAKNATLEFGNQSRYYHELFFRLRTRDGFGTTDFPTTRPETVRADGRASLEFVSKDRDANYRIAPTEPRIALASINGFRVTPTSSVEATNSLKFEQLAQDPDFIPKTAVVAKKAVILPFSEVQFRSADVYFHGVMLFRVPFYDLAPIVADEQPPTNRFLYVTNNQIELDYPYYFGLSPRSNTILHFREGERYGSYSPTRGFFMDFETNWNRGDAMQGGVSLSGLSTSDWSPSFHQYLRLDDRSTLNTSLTFPQGRNFLGSGDVFRQFSGFTARLSASASQNYSGLSYGTQFYGLDFSKDPIKLGKFPFQVAYGVSSTYSHNDLIGTDQTYGPYATLDSRPLNVGTRTSLTSTFRVSKLTGSTSVPGVTLDQRLNLTRNVSRTTTLSLGYEFLQDGFSDRYLGKHHATVVGYYDDGRVSFSGNVIKGFGVDRYYFDNTVQFRISRLWKLTYASTTDQALGDTFYDALPGFAYRFGTRDFARDIGLTYSQRNQRIGIQFLGASSY